MKGKIKITYLVRIDRKKWDDRHKEPDLKHLEFELEIQDWLYQNNCFDHTLLYRRLTIVDGMPRSSNPIELLYVEFENKEDSVRFGLKYGS